MEINTKFKYVEGTFETDSEKLSCVVSRKHAEVELCFHCKMHIPFAQIKLYNSSLWVDAEATFEDAKALGDEIVRRWNAYSENAESAGQEDSL